MLIFKYKLNRCNPSFVHSVIHLTGNKCDLEEAREVKTLEAETACEYLPEVFRNVETSAKENTNIDSIFFCLASELKVPPA
jgi:GTPase SAR1 family protein